MVQSFLGIRQFRQDDCLSYIAFDRPSRQAMVVDPRLDLMNDYREFLSGIGARVIYSADTRLHADPLSGGHLFPMEQGGEFLMSARTTSQRNARKLRDRESLALGSSVIEALHVPGASEDGLAFMSREWLLTGDALWISSAGNAELPQANPGLVWETAQRLAQELSDELVVYPGHDREGILFSSLAVEKSRNPILLSKSPQDLLAALTEHKPARYSRSFGSRSHDEYGASAISVLKFRKKLEERAPNIEFIDVREEAEFRAGHIPGMTNLALSNLSSELARLSAAKRVYVSCLSGLRSSLAARTLAYIGLKDVVVVSGGFQAWNQAGFPVTKKEVD